MMNFLIILLLVFPIIQVADNPLKYIRQEYLFEKYNYLYGKSDSLENIDWDELQFFKQNVRDLHDNLNDITFYVLLK